MIWETQKLLMSKTHSFAKLLEPTDFLITNCVVWHEVTVHFFKVAECPKCEKRFDTQTFLTNDILKYSLDVRT